MAITAIVVVVAGSWLADVNLAYGDSHDGQITARFALHAENYRADGLAGSNWLSGWQPYGTAYANHPPGANAAAVAVSSLPGEGDYEYRLFPYAMGLASLVAATGLLRVLRFPWFATVAAVGLLAVVPLFWLYGRVLWDTPLLFAIPAVAIWVERTERLRAAQLFVVVVLFFVAPLLAWIAGATAVAYLAWLVWKRGFDRVTGSVGVALVAGILVSAAWFAAANSASALGSQVEFRVSGGSFGPAEFAAKLMDQWAVVLPLWLLVPAMLGLLPALRDRSRRLPVAISLGLAISWVVALPNGAFIHNYWAYPVLPALTVGLAGGVDWLGRRSLGERSLLVGALGLSAVLLLMLWSGWVRTVFVTSPADLGELVKIHPLPPGQEVAWQGPGIHTARWFSLYTGLPTERLAPDHADLHADDLVVVVLDGLDELSADVEPVVVVGRYGFVEAGDLLAAGYGDVHEDGS